MALRGKVTTSIDALGAEVLLGDVLVPRQVTMTMAGVLGDPDAALHFEVRDGRPDCVEFTVKAKPNGRGIKSSDVAIMIDAIAEGAFLTFATGTEGGPLGGGDDRESWRLRKGINSAIHAPGRGPSRAELEEVARIYREHPNAPTSAVEKMLRYSRRTASRRVQQARDEGLL